MAWIMAKVDVGQETELERGWSYQVKVLAEGRSYSCEVSLSWADYDHWSHGSIAPCTVLQAAVEYLLERREAGELPGKFDCASIRRQFPEIDQELPGKLQG